MDALRLDVLDAALRVHGVRAHARHRPRQGNGRLAERLEGHCEQRDGNLLTRRQQHVHLSRVLVRVLRDAIGQGDEIIRRVAHRRYDHDNLVARLLLAEHSLRYIHDFLCGSDRAATEFLYNKRHVSPPKHLPAHPP